MWRATATSRTLPIARHLSLNFLRCVGAPPTFLTLQINQSESPSGFTTNKLPPRRARGIGGPIHRAPLEKRPEGKAPMDGSANNTPRNDAPRGSLTSQRIKS